LGFHGSGGLGIHLTLNRCWTSPSQAVWWSSTPDQIATSLGLRLVGFHVFFFLFWRTNKHWTASKRYSPTSWVFESLRDYGKLPLELRFEPCRKSSEGCRSDYWIGPDAEAMAANCFSKGTIEEFDDIGQTLHCKIPFAGGRANFQKRRRSRFLRRRIENFLMQLHATGKWERSLISSKSARGKINLENLTVKFPLMSQLPMTGRISVCGKIHAYFKKKKQWSALPGFRGKKKMLGNVYHFYWRKAVNTIVFEGDYKNQDHPSRICRSESNREILPRSNPRHLCARPIDAIRALFADQSGNLSKRGYKPAFFSFQR